MFVTKRPIWWENYVYSDSRIKPRSQSPYFYHIHHHLTHFLFFTAWVRRAAFILVSAYYVPTMLMYICNRTTSHNIDCLFPFYRWDLESLHQKSFPSSDPFKEVDLGFELSFSLQNLWSSHKTCCITC